MSLELFIWLGWRDSNPRMPGPKPGALPLGHIPLVAVNPGDYSEKSQFLLVISYASPICSPERPANGKTLREFGYLYCAFRLIIQYQRNAHAKAHIHIRSHYPCHWGSE
jgi:hypothetical protein